MRACQMNTLGPAFSYTLWGKNIPFTGGGCLSYVDKIKTLHKFTANLYETKEQIFNGRRRENKLRQNHDSTGPPQVAPYEGKKSTKITIVQAAAPIRKISQILLNLKKL